MTRRIVVLKSHEWLHSGWAARAFAPAAANLASQVKVSGVEFHDKSYPIPLFQPGGVAPPHAALRYGGSEALTTPAFENFAVVADFANQDAVDRLKRERADTVVGVYADPTIEATPPSAPYCQAPGVGTFRDVRKALSVTALSAAKCTGKGVRVAIVDTGIHGANLGPDGHPISQSIDPTHVYSPVAGYRAGTAPVDHATMCSFDVLLAAPAATLLDYALLQAKVTKWSAFLSDALAAFANLIDLLKKAPGPLVVNNSWGMFDRRTDDPIGSPGNYSANPNHPFNQITGALVAAGADVLFAAGNCGAPCPDGRCGPKDVGPGASIHGANSHPSVITIAAVTVKKVRLGYSSEGPGGLSSQKPDVACYSHFVGSGVYQADSGTSAASPVAAGLVAALRQIAPKLTPAALKGAIQRSAVMPGVAWNNDLGYGIVDGAKALAGVKALLAPPAAKRGKSFAAAAQLSSGQVAWMLQPTSSAERGRYMETLKQGGSPQRKASRRRATTGRKTGAKSASGKRGR